MISCKVFVSVLDFRLWWNIVRSSVLFACLPCLLACFLRMMKHFIHSPQNPSSRKIHEKPFNYQSSMNISFATFVVFESEDEGSNETTTRLVSRNEEISWLNNFLSNLLHFPTRKDLAWKKLLLIKEAFLNNQHQTNPTLNPNKSDTSLLSRTFSVRFVICSSKASRDRKRW